MARSTFTGRWSHSVSAIDGASSTTMGRTTAPRRKPSARIARDADLFLNLSGGSWFWRDEYARIPRRVFIDSDPVFTQFAIAKGVGWYCDFFRGFNRLFTFGANIGTPDSDVPTGAFTWHKTWQPVITDLWHTDAPHTRDRLHDGHDVENGKLCRCRWEQGPGVRPIHHAARPHEPSLRARCERPDRSAPPARLGAHRRDERFSFALGLSRLHSDVEGRILRRQTCLRGASVRMVQRPDRVLPGRRASGGRARHGVERALAFRHGPVELFDAGGGDRRARVHRGRLPCACPARGRDRARVFRCIGRPAIVSGKGVRVEAPGRCGSPKSRLSRSRFRPRNRDR